MKKRILSIALMIMMLSTVAFAQSTPQIITSNGREICLDEPLGKYVDGVFMVPVRRVCDIFDADCTWFGEERMVVIDSPDNITRLFLYIDKAQFRIFTFTGVITGEAVDLPLEAPLEIVKDRTMVPFEQICRALKGECVWSEDKSVVTVNVPRLAKDTKKAEIYLTSDKTDVTAGDEIEVSIMAKNLDILKGYGLVGLSAGIIFDKAAFEHISTDLTDNKGEIIEAAKFENKEFTPDSVKTVCFATSIFATGDEEVCIGKIVLRAKSDDGGEVKLSNRIYTIGNDTELVYMDASGESIANVGSATYFAINTQPVLFN